MSLPPSIEEFLDGFQGILNRDRALRLAHEACRLQREADYECWGVDSDRVARDESSLVVPEPER